MRCGVVSSLIQSRSKGRCLLVRSCEPVAFKLIGKLYASFYLSLWLTGLAPSLHLRNCAAFGVLNCAKIKQNAPHFLAIACFFSNNDHYTQCAPVFKAR